MTLRHLLASLTLLASAQAQGLIDSDADGMPDALELRLSTSPLASMASDENIADTDADGVPDLAEWIMSGTVSGPLVPIVMPQVRMMALRADGESFARVYIGVVGDPAEYDKWRVLRSAGPAESTPTLEHIEPYIIAQTYVGEVSVLMLGLTVRIPDIIAEGSIGIGAGGSMGSALIGATITLFVSGDGAPMVTIHDAHEVYDTPLAEGIESITLPLDGSAYLIGDPGPVTPPEAAEVCGSTDKREPTGTPGLLKSVVLATGCTSGEWACPAGVCTMSGVGQTKRVVDIFALLGP